MNFTSGCWAWVCKGRANNNTRQKRTPKGFMDHFVYSLKSLSPIPPSVTKIQDDLGSLVQFLLDSLQRRQIRMSGLHPIREGKTQCAGHQAAQAKTLKIGAMKAAVVAALVLAECTSASAA